jgi:hypothetical protein
MITATGRWVSSFILISSSLIAVIAQVFISLAAAAVSTAWGPLRMMIFLPRRRRVLRRPTALAALRV